MKPSTGTGSTLITLKDIELSLGNVVLKQRGYGVEAIAHYYWEDEEPASYVEPPVSSVFILAGVLLCERMPFIDAESDCRFTEMFLEQSVDVLQYMSYRQVEELTNLVEQSLREEAMEEL